MSALPGKVHGQDAHYWTNQYGTRGTLLGGAVVDSVVDISATFYNPGALGLIEDPELFAVSKVIEVSNIKVNDVTQEGIDLDSPRLDLAPSFFAGLVPLAFLGKNVVGYSFFTRYEFRPTIEEVQVGSADLVNDSQEDDFLRAVKLESRLDESWVGLTWSYPLGRRLGIGVSQFFAYRNQRGGAGFLTEVYSPANAAGIALASRAYSFYNVRLLWKAGVTFDWQGVSFGITATTPSVSLFGSGKTGINLTAIEDGLVGGIDDPTFVADFQDGLSATYRSPWSLAAGAAFAIHNTTVHLASEYFDDVDEYVVLDPDDFVGQSTGDTVNIVITDELNEVLNLAVGVEHRFGPKSQGYVSFRTDFAARVPNEPGGMSVSAWDIFWVTGGGAFTIGGADLTTGIGYGFGGATRLLETPIGDDPGFAPGEDEIDFQYRSLRFIIAFSI